MASSQTQFLVYVGTPENFTSWPRPEKVRFYAKAVEWHKYIAKLKKEGHVERAWGVQKILGEAPNPVGTKAMFIAKYNATADEFSDLITRDPLWNYAVYYAPMLKSMEGDYEDDLARYNRVRVRLETKLEKKLPKAVVNFEEEIPNIKPGGKLQFLVTMRNGPGYVDLSDEQRLSIEERVLQFHDYHGKLRERKIIVDDGACFPIWGFNMKKEGAAMAGFWVLNVNTHDEFSSLILMDPLTVVMLHMTVELIPFEESANRATRELKSARLHLS
jgi:hypothetical protein